MTEDSKVGTYRFVAEPFHVDFMERLTMGVLGNHLLNSPGFMQPTEDLALPR